MLWLNIMKNCLFQLISLIFLLIYFLGVLNTYFSDRNNYCEMTYMFEYPQFVRITVPENNIYPQYALYAYGEGRLTEKTRKMWFDGIPVLYLPGNSGSHMQGRSLASVALRKALASINDCHFDFFMVSYNEDLSGLYGGVLQSETEFAAACITRILSLYKSNKYTKTVPTSVILIGHSMGGIIAKRLLAYPNTIDVANIAITLASPLKAPVVNTDKAMEDFYKLIDLEWAYLIHASEVVRDKKVLISFGSGARDVLVPPGLTSSNDSDLHTLTTSVPGVWTSPDHVSMVWCKQLVLAINRFLFSIVDSDTKQVMMNKAIILAQARQYFQANRSTTLSPDIVRNEVKMIPDAFWYEDNRRMYQISRPEITKTTYLMIRLVNFPQNRFVAVESVNVDDKDWVFGCNAQYTYGTHRYCKTGTSLSELSRWSGASKDAGRRKLATVKLHQIKQEHPSWTHVVLKVSPTRKPIRLNVDINDQTSRQVQVDLPSDFSFSKSVILQETEANSLYYELVLPGFDLIHQAYLLYVEPNADCKTLNYHVSAELHVPWAKNHEYFHYFTHLKKSPMKLRLFQSNPDATEGSDTKKHAKVTLLLDPQCTYTISIAMSWYHSLAQLARNYTPILLPYTAAIVLLAARSILLNLHKEGTCMSMHSALSSDGVKPFFPIVFNRLGAMLVTTIPVLSFLFEGTSWYNVELRYFTKSLLTLPMYMTALGVVNLAAAGVLAVMVFSSQLAHRLLFRIVWRGGPNLAEKVASGLQKLPLLVSSVLVMSVPLSCGAASLAAGAAFYAFMISKMYEEYLEDYVFKMMAKLAARMCRMFKRNPGSTESPSETSLITRDETSNSKVTGESEPSSSQHNKAIEENTNDLTCNSKIVAVESTDVKNKTNTENQEEKQTLVAVNSKSTKLEKTKEDSKEQTKSKRRKSKHELDNELNNLNFHIMMFFLWMIVTLVNVPCLLTWARNFKYSMVLKPDTSYHTGLIMSVCSGAIWQMEGPRKNKKHAELLSALLFTTAILILSLGPFSLCLVNYGVTFMFVAITLHQFVFFFNEDEVIVTEDKPNDEEDNSETAQEKPQEENKNEDQVPSRDNETKTSEDTTKEDTNANNEQPTTSDCDVCNESRIYNIFKNIRDKFSLTEEL